MCPEKLVQWIWHLWGHWSDYGFAYGKKKIPYNDFIHHGPAVSDLAFLMLDPNPKMRITSRQLVTLLNVADMGLYYHASIKKKACSECSAGSFTDMENILLHSVYKDTDALKYPKRPEDALTRGFPPDWETAKTEWLEHHMWR